jgi:hypothetical protein
MLMGWSVPGYFVLQIYVWRKWQGKWRKAALLPLIVMLPLLIYTVFALMMGSNLWPLMLIFITPILFLYLCVVALFKHLSENQHQ